MSGSRLAKYKRPSSFSSGLYAAARYAAIKAAGAIMQEATRSSRKRMPPPSVFFGGAQKTRVVESGGPAARAISSRGAILPARPLGGSRRRSKRKKVRSFVPKVRNTRFSKKVRKVIDSTLPMGDSTVVHYRQLRQIDVDRYRFYDTCERNVVLQAGSVLDVLNHASMLWNAKTLGSNYNVTTSNLVSTKVSIKSYYVDMFFKSTSAHVCNVEVYECTAKQDNTQTPYTDAFESRTDINMRTEDGNGYTLEEINGIKPSHYVELLDNWSVKVHRIKLQPGDYTTVSVPVYKNHVLDMPKHLDNGAPVFVHKGCKAFFFKIINDPTVSATVGNVHSWPSNAIGGVAMRFTKHIRLQCPATVTEVNQRHAVVVYNGMLATGTSTDQQVAFQNPIATTTVG